MSCANLPITRGSSEEARRLFPATVRFLGRAVGESVFATGPFLVDFVIAGQENSSPVAGEQCGSNTLKHREILLRAAENVLAKTVYVMS